MKQLKLPGLNDEQDDALNQQTQWVPSNRIVLGQPFIIWGKPKRADDPDELREVVENVFEASQQIRRVLPWCLYKYEVDPETGTPIIVGVPYGSGTEMVGASITQALVTVTKSIASSFTIVNTPTASFQMSSKLSESRKLKKEEIESQSPTQ